MDLKDYQDKALKAVAGYLEALDRWRVKSDRVVKAEGMDAALDFPQKAWEETGRKEYRSRKNGLGIFTPNFCLKIPNGRRENIFGRQSD